MANQPHRIDHEDAFLLLVRVCREAGIAVRLNSMSSVLPLIVLSAVTSPLPVSWHNVHSTCSATSRHPFPLLSPQNGPQVTVNIPRHYTPASTAPSSTSPAPTYKPPLSLPFQPLPTLSIFTLSQPYPTTTESKSKHHQTNIPTIIITSSKPSKTALTPHPLPNRHQPHQS